MDLAANWSRACRADSSAASQLPDASTRRGIIQRTADQMDAQFPAEVLDLVSTQLQGDARQLAGALNQLEAISRAYGRPIDLAMAESALVDVFRATRRVVQITGH